MAVFASITTVPGAQLVLSAGGLGTFGTGYIGIYEKHVNPTIEFSDIFLACRVARLCVTGGADDHSTPVKPLFLQVFRHSHRSGERQVPLVSDRESLIRHVDVGGERFTGRMAPNHQLIRLSSHDTGDKGQVLP